MQAADYGEGVTHVIYPVSIGSSRHQIVVDDVDYMLRPHHQLILNNNHYSQYSMMPKGQASVALASDPSIRRSHVSPDQLINRPDGDLVKTVGDIFTYAVSLAARSPGGKADTIGGQVWRQSRMLL
jgi:hypothetical protein